MAAELTYLRNIGRGRAFAPLERHTADLIAELPDGLDSDAATEACDAITLLFETSIGSRSKSKSTTSRKKSRSPIADQAELRWRMQCEATTIRVSNTFTSSTASTRQAARHLLPWLDKTVRSLATPMSTPDVVEIAAQWREARAPYTQDPDWADLIIVDPIPRQPPTLWWRLVHGDEPAPSCPTPHTPAEDACTTGRAGTVISTHVREQILDKRGG
ncbi:hypothetical protein GS531_00055 [Rhodococcus hoagii]|nr:hypothetical protein [Prescottella equi]